MRGAPAARPADRVAGRRGAMRRRFPQIDFAGVEAGLYEPRFGALMARRAVQTLVAEFVRAGGDYRQARFVPPVATGAALARTWSRARRRAASRPTRFVFACGPWLGKLFPDLLGRRIFPTRQEVFFFAPEAGDTRFAAGPAARLGRFQRRRHLLRLSRPRGPRLQDRPRRARRRRSTRTPATATFSAAGAGRRARLHGPPLPAPRRPPAQRGAGLPV